MHSQFLNLCGLLIDVNKIENTILKLFFILIEHQGERKNFCQFPLAQKHAKTSTYPNFAKIIQPINHNFLYYTFPSNPKKKKATFWINMKIDCLGYKYTFNFDLLNLLYLLLKGKKKISL